MAPTTLSDSLKWTLRPVDMNTEVYPNVVQVDKVHSRLKYEIRDKWVYKSPFSRRKLTQNYKKIKSYPMKMSSLEVQEGANSIWYITPPLELDLVRNRAVPCKKTHFQAGGHEATDCTTCSWRNVIIAASPNSCIVVSTSWRFDVIWAIIKPINKTRDSVFRWKGRKCPGRMLFPGHVYSVSQKKLYTFVSADYFKIRQHIQGILICTYKVIPPASFGTSISWIDSMLDCTVKI